MREVILPDAHHDAVAPGPAAALPWAHLLLNDELPIFPGSGGVEYLTTLNLPRHFPAVGLVSMAHRQADIDRSAGLAAAGVYMYLWKSAAVEAPVEHQASDRRGWLRRLHERMSGLLIALRAWPDLPVEIVEADANFRNMARPLADALRERNWPVVAVVQSHAARFVRYMPEPAVRVLVLHDVKALVHRRRAAIAASGWTRWRHEREARRYHRFEREACRWYDVVVTVSDVDAEYVRTEYGAPHVVTRRLPIDSAYWTPRCIATAPGLILFTGLMNHPPNVDAAVFMARTIMPLVRAAAPEARFRVVGRHPAPDVWALASLPGVEVTGEVPDVRPHMAQASVVVVPLRFGSGARQKILEAWAMQKCVVSTTVGAEGLGATNGEHLAIADSPQAFADTVVRALKDPSWRESLSRRGRTIVTTSHEPGAIARRYAADLGTVARAKRAERQAAAMRVAIDMRWMTPGLAGGIEQVASSFVREVLALDRHNRYTLILPAAAAARFDLRKNPNVRITTPDGAGVYLSRIGRRVRHAVLGTLRLDDWRSDEVRQLQWVRSLDADMVYAFPGYTHPDVQLLPQVLMVPDIQHEYFPEFFDAASLEERTRVYRDSIRRATHLCAISEFTRRTLIEKLGVREETITTVPLAADPIFGPDVAPSDARILRRFGLTRGSYWFFPGHTWRHKNHATALRAVARLRDVHGLALPLVCTGGRREAHLQIVEEIGRLRLDHLVRWLGYVPRDTLPALYRHAAALVFPSLFEGFGMPVLEAMASGCPVVCSNTTSLPEIAGTAAVLVNPLDDAGLAEALRELALDTGRREALVEAGRSRAAAFSWTRHTLATLDVLRATRARLF